MTETAIVYVAGMGRSGTTLVEGLVAARPGFFAVGEMVFLWERGLRANEQCSCGQTFHDCPFWTAVLADAFGDALLDWAPRLEGAHRDFMRGDRSTTNTDRLSVALEAQRRLYISVAKLSGAPVIVDSSKFPAYGRALVQVPGLDVRVMHVVRDSRAVAHSWQRRKRRPEANADNAFMPVYSVTTTSRDWIRLNRDSDALLREVDRGVRLRYEDLASSPDLVVRSLTTLGVAMPAGPSRAPYGNRHSVSGNPSRMKATPSTVRIDDAWVTEMPKTTATYVTALTAPWLLRYGYRLLPSRSYSPRRL